MPVRTALTKSSPQKISGLSEPLSNASSLSLDCEKSAGTYSFEGCPFGWLTIRLESLLPPHMNYRLDKETPHFRSCMRREDPPRMKVRTWVINIPISTTFTSSHLRMGHIRNPAPSPPHYFVTTANPSISSARTRPMALSPCGATKISASGTSTIFITANLRRSCTPLCLR